MPELQPLRVALIGAGNIATHVAEPLGPVDGAEVIGTWNRAMIKAAGGWDHVLAELNHTADVVVEAATQDAVRDYGPSIVGSGLELVVLSIGALADAQLRRTLAAGPGRLLLSSGAIAGIDHLRAMRLAGPFDAVTMVSTKTPAALRQPWMSAEVLDRLDAATEPMELLTGGAAEVARAFPTSANVAAAVAIATDAWELMTATVVADPATTRSTHLITASNAAGECRFEVSNTPSVAKPSSSMITVFAVVRAIRDLAYQSGRAESPSTMTFV